MLIRRAELRTCAYRAGDFPAGERPEVAFLGRSNVGKSSLINTLLKRKSLARTGAAPGKTRALFFYLVNDSFYFVDLPGYGYARVSKAERRRWAPLIESYLEGRANLCGCVHLVDCRHTPSEDDRLMARWLRRQRLPAVTVAAKADKLSRGALLKNTAQIREALELDPAEPCLAFSAVNGLGREILWEIVESFLARQPAGRG